MATSAQVVPSGAGQYLEARIVRSGLLSESSPSELIDSAQRLLSGTEESYERVSVRLVLPGTVNFEEPMLVEAQEGTVRVEARSDFPPEWMTMDAFYHITQRYLERGLYRGGTQGFFCPDPF